MFRSSAFQTIFICLCIGASPLAQSGVGYREALVRAERAMASGNAPDGLAALDQALRANPEGLEALSLLGQVYLDLSRYDDAATAFTRAAGLAGETSPAGLQALYGLADSYARQERNVEAAGTLERILAIDPTRGAIHHDLGRIHLVLGRLAEAVKEFRIEIDLQEKKSLASRDARILGSSYEGLGLASYRLGDDTTALEALSHAHPTTEAIYHRALAKSRGGEDEEASRLFETVLEMDSENRGALQGLARCKLKLGLKDERREVLSRFQKLYGQDVENNRRRLEVKDLQKRAEQAVREGNFGAAVTAFEQAARLDAENVQVRLDLGRSRLRAGDKTGGIEALNAALMIDPLHAETHYWLGRAMIETDVAGAVASFERASQLAPMRLTYHVYLAQVYMRVGRTDEAVTELRLAQRLNPDDPQGSFNLGLGLAQAGRFPQAAEQLERAVELGFEDPSVHMALAQVYRALGDADRSREAQEKYRQLSSEGQVPQ